MKLVLLLFSVKRWGNRGTERLRDWHKAPSYRVAELSFAAGYAAPESTLSTAEVKRGSERHGRGSSPRGV